MSARVKVGVLISGRGSNMAALIDAARDPAYPAEIAVVISNHPLAPGLNVARAQGVETVAIDHQPYGKDEQSREAHERAMDAALRERGVEVVCLAGYMRVLTPWFVRAWSGRMLNIHPSLLPHFPGLDTHRRALEAGHAEAGCTVHLVTEGVDEGPILGQARVPVLADDTAETLAARVVEAEHVLYSATLATFARELARLDIEARS
ncbi:MAG TPA: phosphoribosylglycinamide formyltransferase [Caulobacteraceae bacterium]|jgi:formyltetrahydrofolate-dependent phosphoribosylglycinamide formyltransferase|nr:phosphoribosylglycinamide formyltransferase [Caulobacteraceae bacterium]